MISATCSSSFATSVAFPDKNPTFRPIFDYIKGIHDKNWTKKISKFLQTLQVLQGDKSECQGCMISVSIKVEILGSCPRGLGTLQWVFLIKFLQGSLPCVPCLVCVYCRKILFYVLMWLSKVGLVGS